MSATVFQQVGPYAIVKRIGGGGMGLVFLARDTRNERLVALKVVPDGPEADEREILAAEQRGAELQQKFSQASDYVPRVHDVGFASDCFYIAMEYVDGEDLSVVIRRGPMAPKRAAVIAVQLCRFLEDVDRVETIVGESSGLTLLHNDLKPTNVRLVAGDRVKVLDFGAAKALTLSRKVTRNDFGSVAYLSPECLDTGERDRLTDAWALGVILYEMIAGRAPFRADDTRRLEARIRTRRPPDPLTGCPAPLQAIVAKLLAAYPSERYRGAGAIREDLERFANGAPTVAEGEGWPNRAADEPPTRRTREPIAADPPTRPTPRPHASLPDLPATERLPTEPAPAAPPNPRMVRVRRLLRGALLLALLVIALNEACVSREAQRLAATVPLQELPGVRTLWTEYQSLARRSYLGGLGARDLRLALSRQTDVLAERVLANYRTPTPTVREAQWRAAADALQQALAVSPADGNVRAALRCAQGHLHRIDGEAARSRGQTAQAQREFAEAVSAFREAAALRQNWPDPFLGLARTFIYGMEDIDRGADAMNQAQKFGHAIGSREMAQLADGYRVRGETLERAAGELTGMPQERDLLTRSVAAYRQALDLYSKIASFAEVPGHIRNTQNRLNRVERRLTEMGESWE